MRKITTLLGVVGALLSTALPAAAIPYNGASVYKATDGDNQVIVFSANAGSRITVNLGSSPRPVARLAGSCGEIRISPPASGDFTGLEVDGTAINASSLSVQTLPSCVSGSFSQPRTTNFKTSTGQVVIVGKTPGAAVAVSLPAAVTRTITANACGFAVLRPRTGETLATAFSVNATSYTLAALPNATNPPYCRTVNGSAYSYIPASWVK